MIEVQDVLRKYFADFLDVYSISYEQFKVVNSLLACRTASLGAHVDICDNCSHSHVSYNSCRNRHCPKCQHSSIQKWLSKQQEALLDVQYFHVVFTIPEALNGIALLNRKFFYDLLFKSASETLLELASDSKYLGADIGFSSILHTWGQNLSFHPHLHCVVSGGGLDSTNNRFVKSKDNFFIPVKVLSRKFRGKFLFYLKQAFYNNDIVISSSSNNIDFPSLLDSLYSTEWVVFCKPSFEHVGAVLKYLSSYTHRIAISNSRIISMDDGIVIFKFKDYKDNNRQKVMSLSAVEFIRRFLLHVLPNRFVKIRHYGFLANRNRKKKLMICRRILGLSKFLYNLLSDSNANAGSIRSYVCPSCNNGRMRYSQFISSVQLLC